MQYIARETRDSIQNSADIVNVLFYDRVFNVITTSREDMLRHKAFEIISSMISDEHQRLKLAKEDYLERIFQKMDQIVKGNDPADTRLIEKLSWMATLISYHQDMFEHIIRLGLLDFVITISDKKYNSTIRSNAVLAISLLTYDERLFDELINRGVIDLIMQLCQDTDQQLVV